MKRLIDFYTPLLMFLLGLVAGATGKFDQAIWLVLSGVFCLLWDIRRAVETKGGK